MDICDELRVVFEGPVEEELAEGVEGPLEALLLARARTHTYTLQALHILIRT